MHENMLQPTACTTSSAQLLVYEHLQHRNNETSSRVGRCFVCLTSANSDASLVHLELCFSENTYLDTSVRVKSGIRPQVGPTSLNFFQVRLQDLARAT